ncbi:MAG: 5-bromo-4-chloroindolyl phosphate hydrolysis family protein [Pseudomonadota bacterium]
MAQRYGGQFSPDKSRKTQSALRHAAPQRGRSRAILLAVAGVPLLVTAFGSGPTGLAMNLIAFAAIALAAWLTREGLEAEEAYNARTISRRPAIPRKLFGTGLLGLGVGVATVDGGIVNAVLYGVIATALHLVSFGLDPMRNKTMDGVDEFQNDRVAKAIDEAEQHLRAMKTAVDATKDRVLIARVDGFMATAREMFRTVENDPRDLRAAKKYLGVYLQGARDATVKYVELTARTPDDAAKADYTALLDDLEGNFTAKTQKLLVNSKDDLEIEIDVLRDRLQREGITPRE